MNSEKKKTGLGLFYYFIVAVVVFAFFNLLKNGLDPNVIGQIGILLLIIGVIVIIRIIVKNNYNNSHKS